MCLRHSKNIAVILKSNLIRKVIVSLKCVHPSTLYRGRLHEYLLVMMPCGSVLNASISVGGVWSCDP